MWSHSLCVGVRGKAMDSFKVLLKCLPTGMAVLDGRIKKYEYQTQYTLFLNRLLNPNKAKWTYINKKSQPPAVGIKDLLEIGDRTLSVLLGVSSSPFLTVLRGLTQTFTSTSSPDALAHSSPLQFCHDTSFLQNSPFPLPRKLTLLILELTSLCLCVQADAARG